MTELQLLQLYAIITVYYIVIVILISVIFFRFLAEQ